LILSYILHGNIPFYDSKTPHPDPLLHAKLLKCPNLLNVDVDHLTEHFYASRISYSTQALPINVLLDTLVRPKGDTEDVAHHTNVEWRHMPEKAVPHVVVGSTASTGGQWVENPVKASWDIETLSYASMLSLPGYSFHEHYMRSYGRDLTPFMRPSRRQVAEYLEAYPEAAGLDDVIFCGQRLENISRFDNGFYVGSHNVHCKHLILASGIFSELIPPRPLLRPLALLPESGPGEAALPILIVGSGFTAADVIISTPKRQKIIHIFKWAPDTRPSPLKACHQQAYPEYAGVYRRMKLAAATHEPRRNSRPKATRRRSSTPFLESRDWEHNYEGLPNTVVEDVDLSTDAAVLTMRNDSGIRFQRRICKLAYVIGRRGSLAYLDEDLKADVMGHAGISDAEMISGQTLRGKTAVDLEVATDVFVIGSLSGDSLIRFAYGGCAYAAGKIISRREGASNENAHHRSLSFNDTKPRQSRGAAIAMNGMDGHGKTSYGPLGDSLDRRKQPDETAIAIAVGKIWQDSGWWGGGISTIAGNFPA